MANEPAVDDVFNLAVAAHAVAAADAANFLDELASAGTLVAGEASWGQPHEGLLRVLATIKVVDTDAKLSYVRPGERFDEFYRYKGFFTWLFAASGGALASADGVLTDSRPLADRNGALIGRAAADFGRRFINATLYALPELRESSCLLDVGCGDGSRLRELVPTVVPRGIGVDVSEDAIRAALSDADTGSPLELFVGDARSLGAEARRLHEVDCILCALMAHDLLPREQCIETLADWRRSMPSARRLILCETVRVDAADPDWRIPSLGYEYLHGLMHQTIASDGEWKEILDASGWQLLRRERLKVPANTLIYVCKRRTDKP